MDLMSTPYHYRTVYLLVCASLLFWPAWTPCSFADGEGWVPATLSAGVQPVTWAENDDRNDQAVLLWNDATPQTPKYVDPTAAPLNRPTVTFLQKESEERRGLTTPLRATENASYQRQLGADTSSQSSPILRTGPSSAFASFPPASYERLSSVHPQNHPPAPELSALQEKIQSDVPMEPQKPENREGAYRPSSNFSHDPITAMETSSAAPPMPRRLPDHVASPHEKPVAQPGSSTLGALSAYSGDSREWAERFPVRENNGMNRGSDAVSSTAMRYRTSTSDPDFSSRHGVPSTSEQAAPYARLSGTVGSEAGNDAAYRHTVSREENRSKPVASTGYENIPAASPAALFAAAEKNSVAPPMPAGPGGLLLDLAPSFVKDLPHTTVCGVVICQSNFPLLEIDTLLDEITMLQEDLTDYMGIPAPREKIELCLFKDETSYLDFLRTHYPEAPRDRRALYIKAPGQAGVLLVQRTNDFEIDLRHEMTHAIVHAGIDNVPIWLDEGLAKYYELKPRDRAYGNPYLKSIRWNVGFGLIPSLVKLEKLRFIDDMGTKEYRDSWSWVHFLIHYSPQTHQTLAGYLKMLGTLNGRERQPPTLSGYLNEHLPNLRSPYSDHFKRWKEEKHAAR